MANVEIDTPLQGYRYRRDIDLFNKAVNIARELISSGDVLILFGYNRFCVSAEIVFPEEDFQERFQSISYDDFVEILEEEIVCIIEKILLNDINENPRSWLAEIIDDESVVNHCVDIFYKKVECVNTQIIDESYRSFFDLKLNPLKNKIAGFDYSICKHVSDENSNIAFAQLTIATSGKLVSVMGSPKDRLMILDNADRISFVCDKNDIDNLVLELLSIKIALEEEES
ncbi:MAG: hypothetical protein FWE11_07025 [Defluviitaleaceae bacterium]|nr:hypothetical protein [Defluviitaleaceae bacterium]